MKRRSFLRGLVLAALMPIAQSLGVPEFTGLQTVNPQCHRIIWTNRWSFADWRYFVFAGDSDSIDLS